MSEADSAPNATYSNWRILRKYSVGLAPFILVWLLLVAWLVGLLYNRANWSEQADEATMREWLDEARTFRKSLPELIREYVAISDNARAGNVLPERVAEKRAELYEQLRAMAEPTRAYLNQLPGFPILYSLRVTIQPEAGSSESPERIAWENTLPRPRQQNQTRVQALEYSPVGDERIFIRCEYTLHAFNKHQQREQQRRQESLVAGAVLIAATLIAAVFVTRFLARELRRETQQLKASAEAEHRERELLETRLHRQEAERAREELDRKLLEGQLETAELEMRAAEAEKATFEMKSQLYASIGIMAGSYAHNIKNLLVRPNDLLSRCIESQSMNAEQESMLHEVQHTLGTVTERLQQILRTVRRDPANTEITQVDLVHLVQDSKQTWAEMAWDKWKLRLNIDMAFSGPYMIEGDLSHLQQAVENLIFNARDATFEMRNYLREEARRDPQSDAASRKQKLLDAAAWKGEIIIRLQQEPDAALFEIHDNGIGMTEEVRANCLRTHFTTKRDNALYEGYSAGMGLGLSFVAMVLEHHRAQLEIISAPLHGTTFRIRFPLRAGAAERIE